MYFRNASLGFSSRVGPIDGVIKRAEQSPVEDPSVVAHVFGVSVAGNVNKAQIIEARGRVVEGPILRYCTQDVSAVIYECKLLSEQDELEIVAEARRCVGQWYGYERLVAHLLDRLTGGTFFRRLINPKRRPICPIPWAVPYAKHGILFKGLDPVIVQPDDMHDHVRASSDWEAVGVL